MRMGNSKPACSSRYFPSGIVQIARVMLLGPLRLRKCFSASMAGFCERAGRRRDSRKGAGKQAENQGVEGVSNSSNPSASRWAAFRVCAPSRSNSVSNAGRRRTAAVSRPGRTRPEASTPSNASDKGVSTSSEMTRRQPNGTPAAWHVRATAAVSMSTATAPLRSPSRRFSSGRPTTRRDRQQPSARVRSDPGGPGRRPRSAVAVADRIGEDPVADAQAGRDRPGEAGGKDHGRAEENAVCDRMRQQPRQGGFHRGDSDSGFQEKYRPRIVAVERRRDRGAGERPSARSHPPEKHRLPPQGEDDARTGSIGGGRHATTPSGTSLSTTVRTTEPRP